MYTPVNTLPAVKKCIHSHSLCFNCFKNIIDSNTKKS